MNLTIQYIVIGLVFVVAMAYLFKKFIPSKKKSGGCAKGCGCAMTDTNVEKSNL
ncbi:FeoB-associated Cys-rich membrane protein [Sphingobacterium bambusae]|uniref:FeoB-associated Cys-rich membrane protein n=1 Tax=Sphingobacterium bambusae TaxID=662858 RepID=A0ABW6BBD3_9SPHI|nr:FeoB-associated Cys-rich membrane protein [Sphingobacterium bambusae]WPL48248.1 FeoB-associated Cys-rich membrane protein [Sphingobacterium bambusae]